MAKKPTKLFRVFLSHAGPDRWIARMMHKELRALKNVKPFLDDRDLEGGDNFPDRIREEIAESDEVWILVTPNSVNRPWVIYEAGMAFQAAKRIVPICYTANVRDLPNLSNVTEVDLNDLEQKLRAIEKRAGGMKS
jgi:hypothetical protein